MIKFISLILTSVIILVACDTASDPTATQVPASDTPAQPTAILATATETLPPATLPPTWTPAPTQEFVRSTREPSVTPTIIIPDTPEPICYVLAPDRERNVPSEFVAAGEPTTIYWNPIPDEAYSYNFKLYHPDGNLVLSEIITDDSFTIPNDILVATNFTYGWELVPQLDGEDACLIITGEIYITP